MLNCRLEASGMDGHGRRIGDTHPQGLGEHPFSPAQLVLIPALASTYDWTVSEAARFVTTFDWS